MTINPDSSTDGATNPFDDARPSARNPSQRLTREQFEAAMRVMDARSASRPLAGPAQDASGVSPSA
jgi:hypothetical protein